MYQVTDFSLLTQNITCCCFISVVMEIVVGVLNLNRVPKKCCIKGLLHGYEWGLRFGGLELRFG